MDFNIEMEVWTSILGFLPYRKGQVKLHQEDESLIISKVKQRLETKFNGVLPKFKYYIINYYNKIGNWETVGIEGWSSYLEKNQLEIV